MIPNVVHFVFGLREDFGGIPFSLVHLLAVRSAHAVNRPDAMYLHCVHEPSGIWWERAKELLNVVRVEPIVELGGRPVEHAAHRTDYLRLAVLWKHGGIYLDLDTICVRPFSPLLRHRFVMGREEDAGYCNAVMMGRPGSPFVEAWLDSFRDFRPQPWGWHAVLTPQRIGDPFIANGELTIEPTESFFCPLYRPPDLERLFARTEDFPLAYCHHLWEQKSWAPYLQHLSPDRIRSSDTTYNRLAQPFVHDL